MGYFLKLVLANSVLQIKTVERFTSFFKRHPCEILAVMFSLVIMTKVYQRFFALSQHRVDVRTNQ